MSDDQQDFLRRWSRRKLEAGQAEAKTTASPAKAPEAPAGEAAPSTAPAAARSTAGVNPSSGAAELPPLDKLQGAASDYRDFLAPGVDESLRRAALKKLFQDPHFNTMDGLDVYIDDYTKADPIPEAMLKTLNQAKGLVFDREDERGADVARDAPEPAVDAPTRASEPAQPEAGDSEAMPTKSAAG